MRSLSFAELENAKTKQINQNLPLGGLTCPSNPGTVKPQHGWSRPVSDCKLGALSTQWWARVDIEVTFYRRKGDGSQLLPLCRERERDRESERREMEVKEGRGSGSEGETGRMRWDGCIHASLYAYMNGWIDVERQKATDVWIGAIDQGVHKETWG